MIKLLLSTLLFFAISASLSAQVGINTATPDASSALDIVAKNNNGGLLIPRIPLTSLTDNVTIQNPAVSLLVYNTTDNSAITKGFYYWDGMQWLKFSNKTERLFYGNADPQVLPTNASGDIYVNQVAGSIFVFNGTNWISQSSSSGFELIKVLAVDGQLNFSTPWTITANKTKVYRNGVNINFTITGNNTVVVENEAKCYANDEIKIYKFL